MTTEQNTQKEIKFTDAEIAMIHLKREQEELDKKKRDVERQIKEGEEIQKKRKQIEYDAKRDAQLVTALEELFKELPTGYELVDISKDQVYEGYHYDTTKVEDERYQYYFKETISRLAKKIVHKESKSAIKAHFYNVSVSSFRSVEKGIRFELDISGIYDGKLKNLSSAKTINKKIQDYVSTHKRKESAKKEKLEGIEWLEKQITDTYPQATVTQEQEKGYRVEYGPDKGWREGAKYIRTTFTSGLELNFTWRKKEVLSIHDEEGFQVVRIGFNLSKVSDEKKEAFINSLI